MCDHSTSGGAQNYAFGPYSRHHQHALRTDDVGWPVCDDPDDVTPLLGGSHGHD